MLNKNPIIARLKWPLRDREKSIARLLQFLD